MLFPFLLTTRTFSGRIIIRRSALVKTLEAWAREERALAY